jgi:uncharacterized protein
MGYAVFVAAVFGGMVTSATAASFDCEKASTRIEKMICQDDGLGHLDDQMADKYRAQLAARPNDPSVREAQAAWLRERNRCPDEACLALAYLDRLRTLSQGGQPATQPPATTDADLLKQVDELNSKCRGGSGDNPATMAACDQREVAVSTLKERGWCWGPANVAEYQKSWQRCSGTGTATAATPSAKCLASMERYQRAFAMSHAAKICSIRGDRHIVVFDNARRAIFNGPVCQGIAPKDIEAGLDRIFISEVGKIGMRNNDSSSWDQACRRLKGSPGILSELDATFRELTLGYR